MIEKRGNSYRVRKTANGKTYSFSFDHKPTKVEIQEAFNTIADGSLGMDFTFEEAAEGYFKTKSSVLSPSTIVNYRSILRNIDYVFCRTPVNEIDSLKVQKLVNDYSKDHSPKSVKNMGGFVTTVLSLYKPNLKVKVTYPQAIKYQKIVPTEDMVKQIIEDSIGSDYEIVYRLAIFGLRKSEMIAVTADKLNGNLLTIDTAKVVTDDGTYKEKTTKTVAGTRQIMIDEKTALMIKIRGYVYNGFPGNILRDLHRRQKKLGLPPFNLHSFRAYYASFCHANGIPDAYIMKTGGWANQSTLDNIYRKTLTDQEETMAKEIIQKFVH